MAFSNSAALLDSKDTPLRIVPQESYKPGKGEVLIEIHSVAVNPCDSAMQALGVLIEKFPFILGCDAAGVVVEVGEGVSNLSVGTRVLAYMTALEGPSRGAFQKYGIAPEVSTTPIPNDMSFSEASVIPLAYMTSLAGLYRKDCLGLPLPSTSPKKSGKTLFLWGGATSVGCIAIQLAVASGLDVITTASPRNFELCQSLGAKEVFDYHSDSIVKDVKAALQGKELAGIYEASGMADAMASCSKILSDLGGGFMATAQPPPEELPSTVRARFIRADEYRFEEAEDTKFAFQDFLTAALESGQMKPMPPAEIVGHGLESVQAAIDTWRKGVSAKKVVVDNIN